MGAESRQVLLESRDAAQRLRAIILLLQVREHGYHLSRAPLCCAYCPKADACNSRCCGNLGEGVSLTCLLLSLLVPQELDRLVCASCGAQVATTADAISMTQEGLGGVFVNSYGCVCSEVIVS